MPIRQIRASGGGAAARSWRQIQADVFGRKVVTINSEEGPAYGVALLAAVGAANTRTSQEACRATIRVVSQTVPKPREKGLRRRFPGLSAAVSIAEGRFQGDRRTGVNKPHRDTSCGQAASLAN